jgi:hypothetical protein
MTERAPSVDHPTGAEAALRPVSTASEQPMMEHEPAAASEQASEVMAAPDLAVESVAVAAAPPAARAPRPPRFAPPARRSEAPVAPRHPDGEEGAIDRGATAPQLRRFIKSRAYVPMHELRRRFVINGGDDDVTAVDVDRQRVFVGLPEREGRLLGELLRGGDIGYELSLDPISPIVVGVYPMRPVTRA